VRHNGPMRVHRSFAFLDLSGFTRFTDVHGDQEAVRLLTRFRAYVREAASDHAVRVDKWLGDGVMLVSTKEERLVEASVGLMRAGVLEEATGGLPLRGGLATGPVLLLEGDDYVGSAVNLAARLCSAAGPGEMLATATIGDALPEGTTAIPRGALAVPGFTTPIEVICVGDDTALALRRDDTALTLPKAG